MFQTFFHNIYKLNYPDLSEREKISQYNTNIITQIFHKHKMFHNTNLIAQIFHEHKMFHNANIITLIFHEHKLFPNTNLIT